MTSYLTIRRQKTTLFLDFAESDTITEVKKVLAGILKTKVDHLRLKKAEKVLEDDKKLLECDLGHDSAKVVSPAELTLALKENDEWEKVELTPYSVPPPLPEAMARGLQNS